MDWVHCNCCYTQPPRRDRKFFLTNCRHLICSLCLAQERDVCLVCKCTCSYMPLSASMKPDIEAYFTDLGDLMRKQLKKWIDVHDFQKMHRNRLRSYRKSCDETETQTTARLKELESANESLRKENYVLKTENTQLKALEEQLREYENDEHFRVFTPSQQRPLSQSGRTMSGATPLNSSARIGSALGRRHQTAPYFPVAPSRASLLTPPSGGRISATVTRETLRNRSGSGSNGESGGSGSVSSTPLRESSNHARPVALSLTQPIGSELRSQYLPTPPSSQPPHTCYVTEYRGRRQIRVRVQTQSARTEMRRPLLMRQIGLERQSNNA
ncbi:probable E3 SUMO-protein ligase RNF212 [Oscarella lobularis]|uniref:probable E3 SUMO-protein ligase RNF212 n=1 Tax=Oscarella lobularis TaxID=121494 RepID=UPI0033137B4A